jgi:ribosomal protein S12 methylthiotransferase accessory factor
VAQHEAGESEVALARMAGEHGPRAASVTLRPSDALQDASFHLVHARIEWTDGAPTEGWGRDADHRIAQLKAVAEAVERSAYLRLPASAFEATASELRAFIAPTDLVRYAPWQYAQAGFPFHPFRPDERRCWVQGVAQADGSPVAVAADCICNPRAFDAAYRRRLLTYATTSGCASGRSRDDALLRAVLELVERDAFMRHWFAQTPGLAVRAGSLPAWAEARLLRLRQDGCQAGVQCLTAGVHPTWLAWARHEQAHFTCVGAACGLEAEAALGCALQELETAALARIDGAPTQAIDATQVRSPADHAALYATRESFHTADRLLLARDSVGFGDVAPGFAVDATGLYGKLRRAGHPVYCVDLSIADADTIFHGPIRTVRAVAPGLIPMAFGVGLQPLGMIDVVADGAHDIHPFS